MARDRLVSELARRFARAELLERALTHRSAGGDHNERLEFLGDSIVNCVIAIALFERFGELREGALVEAVTQARAGTSAIQTPRSVA